MNSLKNNYAFIDSQNVYLSIKRLGWKIDWKRFHIYLKEHYCVSKAFLFIGYIEGNNDLYSTLQQAGFICIFKPVLIYKNGAVKGNVDAEMVLHTMIEYGNFEKAIIVTSDGDFYCLVQYLLENNKLETTLAPGREFCSSLLKRFTKKKIAFMDNLRNRIGEKE